MGLSQKGLAELLGVGKNTIWNYENGGKIPESKLKILVRKLKDQKDDSIYQNSKATDLRFES